MRTFFLLSIFLLFISEKAIGQNKKGKKVKQQNSTKTNSGPDYDWSFCTRVETDAKFGDDITAWNKYLQQYVSTGIPKMNGAPVGTYEVIIQFIVDKNGVINEIMPLTRLGYGMEEEVIRIIKISPKWIPATHNGRCVSYRRRQYFIFTVSELLITSILIRDRLANFKFIRG